ncbi:hypothetical protein H257_18283 [Aphanomyces astaci]|uniref:Glyoxalase/fosfomycin resistance/dioxygenase domain-containing protein n=1 Tax=Aphanomyces astaci TaxID=112090 RepID=W4FDV1_APHAT|nr:hypothetical protein H257_18283 [Aphanomyces astaci]ETV64918.1 hypothetical protein H257_18283 [Aphanomyces astaci]RHY01784.1 hypothetical protein DYB36_006284 [Aphanomyces astaci]RHY84252.1 hypothetical protein DYB26_007217 [Aphanomyces astaci]RHY87777.1 hypothetical protein DYB35_009223 [Aphanomyces astaci]RHZ06763.1 hypothetical protein DYB37_006198 [Aphanomyces astaci]|eukprot:XP_009845615.1 hypothetical protein H257_18283 [Aphanomyces astaci]
MNLTALDLRSFVPAADFGKSKAFYTALGFDCTWSSDNLAVFRYGPSLSFYLQAFNEQAFIDNYMMFLSVENVADWFVVTKTVTDKFQTRLGEVRDQPWGQRDFTFQDPCGVCWRVAQTMEGS